MNAREGEFLKWADDSVVTTWSPDQVVNGANNAGQVHCPARDGTIDEFWSRGMEAGGYLGITGQADVRKEAYGCLTARGSLRRDGKPIIVTNSNGSQSWKLNKPVLLWRNKDGQGFRQRWTDDHDV